jgi:hypothetical protein
MCWNCNFSHLIITSRASRSQYDGGVKIININSIPIFSHRIEAVVPTGHGAQSKAFESAIRPYWFLIIPFKQVKNMNAVWRKRFLHVSLAAAGLGLAWLYWKRRKGGCCVASDSLLASTLEGDEEQEDVFDWTVANGLKSKSAST